MLGRLVAKLLVRASVPLVAVAGVLSYGIYLKGGDPASLWEHVSSGVFGQASGMLSGAREDMAGIASQMSDTLSGATASETNSSTTTVFTWKDGDGVTHFGTVAPAGTNAQVMQVDPNANVLAPLSVPVSVAGSEAGGSREAATGHRRPTHTSELLEATQRSASGGSSESVRELESELGEPLPGVAGQILSTGAGSDGGIDPSQLIRLLQSSGK